MGITPLAEPLVSSFAAQKPLRTGSLVVTIFGDAIAPRGGEVWLGSLIKTLEPLGISQRVVRTAVYRLVQDGMLSNNQVGKRSFYTLTESGRRQFDEATLRIYATPEADWDGHWCLVFVDQLSARERHQVRRDLQWLGFGQLNPSTLIHPNPDLARLRVHLDELGVHDRCPIIRGQGEVAPQDWNTQFVSRCWELDVLERGYKRLIDRFAPILSLIQEASTLSSADAFYIRTFLIHEYRKSLLRDPQLPYSLLPESWRGREAFRLTRELYQAVVEPAERFIDRYFENETGKLAKPTQSFYLRLGGLADD